MLKTMAPPVTGNVGIVTFRADHDYNPQEEGEIKLRKGDFCVVPKPILDINGWLTGTNKNTGEHGEFPGTFVSVVEDYTPPAPPRPPKPDGPRRGSLLTPQIDWKRTNNHNIEKILFAKPVWCLQCNDYIWGHRQTCFWCDVCYLASHPGCSHVFTRENCENRKFDKEYEKADLMRPVEHWDNTEVLEWLAAIRAYQYIHAFKDRGITGGALYEVDEQYLKKVLAIPHDFDIKNLAKSIKELTRGTERVENSGEMFPFVSEPNENFSDSTRAALETHAMREHTFTTPQICDVCKKFMFGLVRQGLTCKACGLQCHRYCAHYGLMACKKRYYRSRRSSDASEPAFGQDFSGPTGNPTLIIKKLVKAVEEKGLELKDVYLSPVPFLELLVMRNALNQAPSAVNMRESEWQNPRIHASVLKQYLLEMPASIIPPDYYDNFVIAAKLCRSSLDNFNKTLVGKIKELPRENRDLLEFLQAHLIRLCDNYDLVTLDKIYTTFSVLILRPPESNIKILVKNLDNQKYVMELLIQGGVDIKPSIPDREPTAATPMEQNNLESAEWYWGPISREIAAEKLKHTPDGTFLVRDSSKRGEYTLTIRKDGGNKLVRIFEKNGKYGFTDSTSFFSLNALIDHFFTHSLKEYNSGLDIKLLYPVTKYENLPEMSTNQIEQQLQEASAKMGQFYALELKLEESSEELEEAKLLLESQTEVIRLLEEQINLARGYVKEVAASDRFPLEKTIKYMTGRLGEEKRALSEADDLFKRKGDEYSGLEKTLNDMKYIMPEIEKTYNDLGRKLKESNPERADYFDQQEEEGIYDELPAITNQREAEELPQESWFFGAVKRDDVRRWLSGKPDGTFLVRKSERNPGQYVISLVHEQAIKHITIERGSNGYGFAEPYNIYPDLKSVVHHYHRQSLRMHNPHLDTTLMFPIKYIEDDENIYMSCNY